MRSIQLTKAIMYAVLFDTYNAARRRGLSDDDAADKAQAEFDRLFELIGGAEGWMKLPS